MRLTPLALILIACGSSNEAAPDAGPSVYGRWKMTWTGRAAADMPDTIDIGSNETTLVYGVFGIDLVKDFDTAPDRYWVGSDGATFVAGDVCVDFTDPAVCTETQAMQLRLDERGHLVGMASEDDANGGGTATGDGTRP